jgi:hypothetical protein
MIKLRHSLRCKDKSHRENLISIKHLFSMICTDGKNGNTEINSSANCKEALFAKDMIIFLKSSDVASLFENYRAFFDELLRTKTWLRYTRQTELHSN